MFPIRLITAQVEGNNGDGQRTNSPITLPKRQDRWSIKEEGTVMLGPCQVKSLKGTVYWKTRRQDPNHTWTSLWIKGDSSHYHLSPLGSQSPPECPLWGLAEWSAPLWMSHYLCNSLVINVNGWNTPYIIFYAELLWIPLTGRSHAICEYGGYNGSERHKLCTHKHPISFTPASDILTLVSSTNIWYNVNSQKLRADIGLLWLRNILQYDLYPSIGGGMRSITYSKSL